MRTRRQFLQTSALLGALGGAAPRLLASPVDARGARVVSTW
ncbi:twin-arginine translocation signal domain-containing protein, partial [Stenotrophomonas pictorum]